MIIMAKKKKKSNGGGVKPVSKEKFLTQTARTLPIYKCYVTDGWEKEGEVTVVVTRERPGGNLCVAGFLCDAWCVGIKDVVGSVNMSKEDFQEKFLKRGPELRECDYVYAHNLIYAAEAFAADVNIKPHPDFALWSHVIEEDTEDVPLMEIEFGDQGKYHLVVAPGSRESLLADGLKKQLGDDFICEIVDYRPEIDSEDYF